jgi:hypothetical protein
VEAQDFRVAVLEAEDSQGEVAEVAAEDIGKN